MSNDYIPQSSASDRYEAARKALAFNESVDRGESDYERTARDGLAEALRALITPPGVHESEGQIADRIMSEHGYHDPRTNSPESSLARDVARAAVRAGIQAAHETWECEDRPTQEQMLRWLGIDYEYHGPNGVVIQFQIIDREDD